MGRLPWARGSIEVDREGHAVVRLRIIVREIVDHLLYPNRILWRERPSLDETPDIRIRRGIDIDRKSGQRIVRRTEERVLFDVAVARGVELTLLVLELELIDGQLGSSRRDRLRLAPLSGRIETCGRSALGDGAGKCERCSRLLQCELG